MASEDVVGIQPHKAARLATELASAGERLERAAFDVYLPLVDGMEDLGPVLRLLDVSHWLAEEASSLRRLLDDIVGWWQQGRADRHGGVDVWATPYHASFDDPVAAGRAAEAAARALDAIRREPDRDGAAALVALVDAWRTDLAFATIFGTGIDARAVVDLVLRDRDLRVAGTDEAPTRAAISATFGVLASASSAGTSPLRFADLAREAVAASGDPTRPDDTRNALAQLFAEDRRWGTTFVLDAVAHLVVPATRARIDRHVEPAMGTLDPRAVVLAAVARDRDAASRLIVRASDDDLHTLLSSAAGYGDVGEALGNVLVTATAQPDHAESVDAMRRLVGWVAVHHDLPRVARDRLGLIAVRYLGSFRSAAHDDDDVIADPLHDVRHDDRDAFLADVVVSPVARHELRLRELAWVAEQFGGLDPSTQGAAIATVASVDYRISRAADQGWRGDKQAADERQASDRLLWDTVETYAADVVAPPGVSASLGIGLQQGHRRLDPDETRELDWADGASARTERDRAIIETLYLGGLWRRRHSNGLFDGLPPIPADLFWGEPPWLRPRVAMTREQVERFHRWLDDPRVVAATQWTRLAAWGQG